MKTWKKLAIAIIMAAVFGLLIYLYVLSVQPIGPAPPLG
jgi:hypothetical protein